MNPFENNVSFNAVDISLICRDKPQVLRDALREVLEHMAKGDLAPVEPRQTYSVSEVEKAFRIMQAGTTSGKIVIEMDSDDTVMATLDTRPSFAFDPNATCIIAGGLGGIGRSVTTWFVERGARHLALLSRSGSQTARAQELLQDFSDKSVVIKTPACDVSDRDALASALDENRRNSVEGSGFMELARAFTDRYGLLRHIRICSWYLRLQRSIELRGRQRLPRRIGASSYCSRSESNVPRPWPFFSVGIMTENADLQARWKDLVDAPVTEADPFALLDYYCDPETPTASSDLLSQTAVGLAGGIRVDSGSAYYLRKPMFQNLALSGVNSTAEAVLGGAQHDHVGFAAVFATATSPQEVIEALHGALKRKLAATLSLSADDLQTSAPMHSYGVDSLVAVEIRNWFAKELKADIAIFDILGGSTITTVSSLAASKSRFKKAEALAE
ncbi:hypothetical protein LTR95_010732 [Oleoguttula sp. CCFEE 5521]